MVENKVLEFIVQVSDMVILTGSKNKIGGTRYCDLLCKEKKDCRHEFISKTESKPECGLYNIHWAIEGTFIDKIYLLFKRNGHKVVPSENYTKIKM
ncbi:hypothetical protein J4446_01100 [Candidatus Woesearchaeota archaeon]|nr:hypothetical protein [Candidatus Woesearchaeota archaeon]